MRRFPLKQPDAMPEGHLPCPTENCGCPIYILNKTTGDQVECPRCETRLHVRHNADRTTTLTPARRFEMPTGW